MWPFAICANSKWSRESGPTVNALLCCETDPSLTVRCSFWPVTKASTVVLDATPSDQLPKPYTGGQGPLQPCGDEAPSPVNDPELWLYLTLLKMS